MLIAQALDDTFCPTAGSFANVLTKKSLADGHRHEPAPPQRVRRPLTPVPRDLRRLLHDEVGLRDTRQQAKHEHIKRLDVQRLEVEAVGSQPSPLTMRTRGKHTCKGAWLSAFLSCPEASVTHSMQSIDIFVSHCAILLRTNATHLCVNLDMLRISIRGYATNVMTSQSQVPIALQE